VAAWRAARGRAPGRDCLEDDARPPGPDLTCRAPLARGRSIWRAQSCAPPSGPSGLCQGRPTRSSTQKSVCRRRSGWPCRRRRPSCGASQRGRGARPPPCPHTAEAEGRAFLGRPAFDAERTRQPISYDRRFQKSGFSMVGTSGITSQDAIGGFRGRQAPVLGARTGPSTGSETDSMQALAGALRCKRQRHNFLAAA
jgi:hypothetical protein